MLVGSKRATKTPGYRNRRNIMHQGAGRFTELTEQKRRKEMRTFGWAVTIVVGGYATFMLLKSIPDMVRYVKISTM
jgi:hypothetical protein